MADAPAHKFGQIVGILLQDALRLALQQFCTERGLFLDYQSKRPGVRSGRKVSWEDKFGNSHDLDFVIERDATATSRGRPVAFIEAAWRQYTKHSRNKAQEIQGAVLPIAEKYHCDRPFLGAVLAGIFTQGARSQLRSVGFEVAYLPSSTFVAAFGAVGIDTQFDEHTPDAVFADCIKRFENLSLEQRNALRDRLIVTNQVELKRFFDALRAKLDSMIERVLVLPLFGNATNFPTAAAADDFIRDFEAARSVGNFQKFEIVVTFSNRDEIRGVFGDKDRARDFLAYVSR